MNLHATHLVALICTFSALAACSKGASTASGPGATTPAAHANAPTAAGNAAAPAKAGNACDRKLLTAEDMAGILADPITGTEPLKGDAQTCYFITATTDKIMVSVRPGLGKATLGTFTSGKMDAYAKSMPLAGVGDSAVWLPGTYEVDAQKNDVLCVAGLAGSAVIGHKPDDLPKRLGALCNKVFAAY